MTIRTGIIDGRAIARTVLTRVSETFSAFQSQRFPSGSSKSFPKPGLAIVQIGDRAEAVSFTDQKARAAKQCQFHYEMHRFPRDVSQRTIERHIDTLSADERINGIVVQLPMPAQLPPPAILSRICPQKDVDALHPAHVGALWMSPEVPLFQPCTAVAVQKLLAETHIPLSGQHAVIIGAGPIAGCPIARLLLRNHATVTICHAKTQNIQTIAQSADILIAAVGKSQMIDAQWVRRGAVVIDVGITRTASGTRGDVDFDSVQGIASHVTPVPGGVGPMTVAVLMENTLKSFLLSQNCTLDGLRKK